MQLIVTVAGVNPSGLIEELSHTIKDSRCSIAEARLTELAGECAAYALVEGNWNHIARLETALENLTSRLGWKVRTHRVEETQAAVGDEEELIPYAVDIYAPDRVEILHEVVSFFVSHGVRFHDAAVSRYAAPLSGSPLFTAHLVIKIPADVRVISLRDEFLDFCDHHHLDAIMEPIKR
ncbi:MAG TPA: ACT domain-containing protein [Methylococcaceae bacterium]|nr:ACT domain-containing protein [Methylococcaceae bacterium]